MICWYLATIRGAKSIAISQSKLHGTTWISGVIATFGLLSAAGCSTVAQEDAPDWTSIERVETRLNTARQSIPPEVSAADFIGRRDEYQHAIHLFGDSLVRGYALRRFPDEGAPPGTITEMLWAHRSLANILNSILPYDHYAYYAGGAGLPGDGIAPILRQWVVLDRIRPGDTVVIEDAGSHLMDPVGLETAIVSMRTALCDVDITILVLTVYERTDPTNHPEGIEPESLMWDLPFGPEGKTMNDALRDGSTVDIAGCQAQTLVLETGGKLSDMFREGLVPLHTDNIHWTLGGQWLVAYSILDVLQLPYWR